MKTLFKYKDSETIYNNPVRLMKDGSIKFKSDYTFSRTCNFENGAKIGKGTFVSKGSVIGEDAVIGEYSAIINTTICKGVKIGYSCYFENFYTDEDICPNTTRILKVQ